MSDKYEVKGVSVTPLGGGFYELKHPSITAEGNIEKVRGKEAADARADEIGTAAASASQEQEEGHMQQQGTDLAALQEKADGADQAAADADEKLAAKDEQIAALKAEGEKRDRELEELREIARKAAEHVTTIETEGEPGEVRKGRVPAGMPTQFTGELTKEQKKALKAAGLGYTRIILEENSDIPPTGLFVGHNGKGYMIQPGVEVDVPDYVLSVLKDAKMSAPVTDSKSLKVLGYRERMKYPYRTVD